MSKEAIQKELVTVCEKKESKHDILRYINAPTRLEFLTSIALVQNFDGLDVNPNYAVDDEGLPTFTASGGYADIECYDSDYDSYFEVTLMCGRSDQVNNEIIPISRHKRSKRTKTRRIISFLWQYCNPDTKETWNGKIKSGVDILTFNIHEFIELIDKSSKLHSFLQLWYKYQNNFIFKVHK